jgi:DNA-binding MarR family transcriptional regulator
MKRRAPSHFLDALSGLRSRLSGVAVEVYADLGLGPTQAKLLRTVGEGQPMSHADLARATGTDPALTGRALRTLLDRGWVRRRRSREDRRAFSLELTPEGDAQLEKVRAARETLGARIDGCLDAADLAAFDRIAQKLLAAFPES